MLTSVDSEGNSLKENTMNASVFKAIGKFVTESGTPLSGDEYSVKLYDKDPLFDDFFGGSEIEARWLCRDSHICRRYLLCGFPRRT